MSKQVIDAGPNPEVFVEQVQGDLQVRGWEAAEVMIKGDPDEVNLEQQDDRIRLATSGDLDLRLPHGARLAIGEVGGDAAIKFLEDGLSIASVHGSLAMRHIAGCEIDSIHGDLAVKHAAANLHIQTVHGDAAVRYISGDCTIDQVSGNLDIQETAGSIHAACKGTARLRLRDLSGDDYQVEADGNLYCYLPQDASLRITLESKGQVIKIRLPEGSKTYQQSNYELVLGEGEVNMALASGGSIYFFVEQPGWSEPSSPYGGFGLPEDFGQHIAQQVEAQIETQMADVSRRINEQMDQLTQRLGRAGFSPAETEKIIERARQTGERESARAQEKIRRAQEKLERKLEAHRSRSEARSAATDRRTRRQSWGFEWPAPPAPTPPAPPRPAVSEEERLIILRMLEQKKITLEEADRLLSALEGNDNPA